MSPPVSFVASKVHNHAVAHSSDVKIIVSFFTVVATMDTQFGVVWPSAFADALDAFSFMSLDVGMISAAFCFLDFSFYEVR